MWVEAGCVPGARITTWAGVAPLYTSQTHTGCREGEAGRQCCVSQILGVFLTINQATILFFQYSLYRGLHILGPCIIDHLRHEHLNLLIC